MNDFQFLRPMALLLFIPFGVLLFWTLRKSRSSSIWKGICSKELLPYILEKKGKKTLFPIVLTLMTGTLLISAAAGPSWKIISKPLLKSHSALIIALDLSNAMDAADVKPSRLQRAIYKIMDLLKKRLEGQTALIVFSGDAFVVTPLTDDTEAIKALLPALETQIMPSSGHQSEKAMDLAADLFKQASIANGKVLLITSSLTKQELEKSVDVANREGLSISVLAVGTEEGAPIPKQEGGFIKNERGEVFVSQLSKEPLIELATSTNGIYAPLTIDESDLIQLAKILEPSKQMDIQEMTEAVKTKSQDEGYLLVLLALPFALLFFRRGMLTAAALFFMTPQLHAHLSDFWHTPNQQGEQFFHQKDYQKAKELFQNPDWKAAASYQLGEYEEAAKGFQSNLSADGLYNYGTAKAKLGAFDEAIEAYDKALEIDPNHEDALYNKKILEELKKQQQENKEEQNQDSSSNEQGDQKKKSKQKESQNKDSSNTSQKDSSQDKEEMKEGKEQSQEEQSQEEQSQEKQDTESNEKKESLEKLDQSQEDELKNEYQKEMDQKIAENEKKTSEIKETSLENTPPPQDTQREMDDRWLEKIKDDPSSLLRRKFLLKYQQQNQQKGKRT